MSHPNTLNFEDAALVIIDIQEAFRPVIGDFETVVQNTARMTQGASILNLPVVVTEQYPKGLGKTVAEIAGNLPEQTEIVEKTAFSSCGATGFMGKLNELNRKQVIVAGLEAHICVNQTVHDLLSQAFQVHLLTDCITARKSENKNIGLCKMKHSGALPSCVEMALFELMRDAKHEQFKAIQKLIK